MASHGNFFLQQWQNHINRGRNHLLKKQNRFTCGHFPPSPSLFTPLGGQNWMNQQTSQSHSESQHLVFVKNYGCHWKENSISGASSQKHHEISSAPLFRTWCTFPWHSEWNFEPHLNCGSEMQPGTFRWLCFRPVPNWGSAPLQPGQHGIHINPPHYSCLPCQPSGPIWILATTNSFQFLSQCLHHTMLVSPTYWPLNIQNHFKLSLSS